MVTIPLILNREHVVCAAQTGKKIIFAAFLVYRGSTAVKCSTHMQYGVICLQYRSKGTDSHNLLSDCYRRHGKDTCIPSTDSSSPQRRTRSRCDIPAQQTQSTDCSTKQGTCFPGFSKWNHYRHWDSLDQKSANPRDIAPLITSITWYKPTYHVMHLKKRRFCDLLGIVQWNPLIWPPQGQEKLAVLKTWPY